MTIAIVAVLMVAVLAVLVWLLFGPHRIQRPEVRPLEIKKLLPVHCRHFPQIKRILGQEDEIFLGRRASKHTLKLWRKERSQVLRLYMQGLAEDFQNLTELARMLSKLSPELRPSQELELLKATLQFHILYRMTMLRLALRSLPLPELSRLTEMVATLGFELELLLNKMTARVPQAGMHTV